MEMLSSNKRALAFYSGFVAFLVIATLFFRIVIGPFILALVVSYILNPWIETLERRGIHRGLIVITAVIGSILIFLLVLWFLVPTLVTQAEMFLEMLPKLKSQVEQAFNSKIKWISRRLGVPLLPPGSQGIADLLVPHAGQSSWFENIGSSTRVLVSWIAAAVLSPFFAFFVMRDFRRLMLRILALVPPDLRGNFLYFIREANHTLRAVLRGQILVITLLATLYSTAFLICGLPAGIIIGMLTGFCRLIPYMDLVIGGSLSAMVLVSNHSSPSTIVAVLVSFLAIQVIDGIFLTPRIMGQFSGLHPFLIVLSVFCFGDWFGFYGIILAIPLAAFLRVLFLFLIENYKDSRFFKNG